MKKVFSSLPFRLLIALVIGILLGQVFGEVPMKVSPGWATTLPACWVSLL